jgi:hypothetical protein
VSAAENSKGLEVTVEPGMVTTKDKGSEKVFDFGPLILMGWVHIVGGVLLAWLMKSFPGVDLIVPNSLPAGLIVSGIIFAFLTDYVVLLTGWGAVAVVDFVVLSIAFPGWWHNFMKWRLLQ